VVRTAPHAVTDTQTIEMRNPDDFSRGAGIDSEAGEAGAPTQSDAEVTAEGPAADAAATGEVSGPDTAVAADATVAALQEELAGQRDRYLRLAAEFDNFRKRSTRERAEAGIRGQASLIRKLLEVIDDLDRFGAVDPAVTDSATVVEGVVMVCNKLHKELEKAGLEWLDPQGKPFDPNLHEAMATEPAASQQDDGMVARVYQRGYVFHGELLRPARVVVWQWNG
jgi:molecular chaperone GrpE